MKIAVIVLFALVSLAAAVSNNKCEIQDGNNLRPFDEKPRNVNIQVPCKFNAVLQQCGDYKVTLTPGLKFLYPRYIIDTIWIGVNNTVTGKFWEGRTTNKLVALKIVKGKDPFNQKEGTYTEEELFDVTSTTQTVTLKEKNGAFSLTIGAYDFSGNKHHDSTLEFVCHVENTPTAYPKQYCGASGAAKEIKDRANVLFGDKGELGLTALYDIFNDTTIVQTQEGCIQATRIMTSECKTNEQRKVAIEACHRILTSTPHIKCVLKSACHPLDVFVDCMQYACSNYTDQDACERVGQAIDQCREFPGLTSEVKKDNCYTDLLKAEDNPYYVPSDEE